LCWKLDTYYGKILAFAPTQKNKKIKKGGMSHCGLAIYIKKVCEGKRTRIMETQIFHHSKNILIFKKNPSKRNQNPSRFLL
jgi:hypothetical protein